MFTRKSKEEKAWNTLKKISEKFQKKGGFDWTNKAYHELSVENKTKFLREYGLMFFDLIRTNMDAADPDSTYGWLKELVWCCVNPDEITDADLLKIHAQDYCDVAEMLAQKRARFYDDYYGYVGRLFRLDQGDDLMPNGIFSAYKEDLILGTFQRIKNSNDNDGIKGAINLFEEYPQDLPDQAIPMIKDILDRDGAKYTEDVLKLVRCFNVGAHDTKNIIAKDLDAQAADANELDMEQRIALARRVKLLCDSGIVEGMLNIKCSEPVFVRDFNEHKQDLISVMVTLPNIQAEGDEQNFVFVERVPHVVRHKTDDSDETEVNLKAHYDEALCAARLDQELQEEYGAAGAEIYKKLNQNIRTQRLTHGLIK
ncbi:MAG: hypothetical protein CL561_05355 [Alphaproteobacteria bacterium]|nr:hypothetical protein [Alphaproteobacteria bacterium]|tara:strand:+ start:763 stop:1869 length:1107 start_codon:yes stop_codon:yes gene_type:complete